MSGRSLAFVCLVAGQLACSGRTTQAPATADATPSTAAESASPARAGAARRALLIGVTEFLDAGMKKHNLKGPANDVRLFIDVLAQAPLDVPIANVRFLAGLPPNRSEQPTRENIERAFADLAAVAGPHDQIVILLAGHGSQQPADRDANDPEDDGLDEIFLPADASGWDGAVGKVRNAIVDDDIRRWLEPIRKTGAFVWILFDACQSGTMTRGSERQRRIDMSDLQIPASAIAAARSGSGTRGPRASADVLGVPGSTSNIAALYAAHMSETTPERPLPNADSPTHGLFTYTIAEVLKQSATAMTYRELAQRVLDRYRAMQRYAPTPLLEGGGLDREILGVHTWPDRPQLLLTKSDGGRLGVSGGTIQGLTKDSVLEVFPPAGSANANRSVGYVQVRSVAATSAEVTPFEFSKVPAPRADQLPTASRLRVALYAPGDWRLKVALHQRDTRPGAADDYTIVATGAGPRNLEAAFKDLERNSLGLATRVDTEPADWYVRAIGDQLILVPAAGWQVTSAPVGTDRQVLIPRQFIVAATEQERVDLALGAGLAKIGRARNLTRLATLSGPGTGLEIQITRFSSEQAKTGQLFQAIQNPSIRAGEHVEYRLKNTGSVPLDVTMLYIDAAFGIQPILPGENEDIDNQIKPGEFKKTERFKVTDEPLGWESTVAIGVESTMGRQNFRGLRQDGLQSATTRGGDVPRGATSAFGRLLEDAVLGPVNMQTRGPLRGPVGTFAVTVTSWRTDPAQPAGSQGESRRNQR